MYEKDKKNEIKMSEILTFAKFFPMLWNLSTVIRSRISLTYFDF